MSSPDIVIMHMSLLERETVTISPLVTLSNYECAKYLASVV
jgi:hypothetical protein